MQLLQLAAFLAPAPIPLRLFRAHADLLAEPLRTVAADPYDLDDLVGLIVGFSLLRREGDRIRLHRLVQAVIRHQLGPADQQRKQERVLTVLLAAHPGDPDDPATWDGYAELAPHLLATSPLADAHPDGRRLVLDTAKYLHATGDSRGVSTELLDRWRQTLGADHPDTLHAASSLAFARLGLVGEVEPARALGQDTVERCRRVLGPDHPTTLYAATVLTTILVTLGEVEPARALGQDTVERCRRVLGPDHPTTLYAATVLTAILVPLGEVEPAHALGQDTVERCRRVLGPDHRFTLYAAAVLTLALAQLGKAEPARALGQDTVERCRRVLGPDHRYTLYAAAVLTLALAQLGKAEPARALGQDTVERSRRALGPDHFVTLYAAHVTGTAVSGHPPSSGDPSGRS